MKPKKLYVDDEGDQFIRVTRSMDKIKYNCNIINPDILSKSSHLIQLDESIVASFPAGRYVCYLVLLIDTGQFELHFYDFQNRESSLQEFFKMFHMLSDKEREQIRQTFDYLKPNYQKDYNEFELVIGNPPH